MKIKITLLDVFICFILMEMYNFVYDFQFIKQYEAQIEFIKSKVSTKFNILNCETELDLKYYTKRASIFVNVLFNISADVDLKNQLQTIFATHKPFYSELINAELNIFELTIENERARCIRCNSKLERNISQTKKQVFVQSVLFTQTSCQPLLTFLYILA